MVGDDLPGQTVIGCNNTIGYHAVVGVKCQDLKYKVIAVIHVIDSVLAISGHNHKTRVSHGIY